MKLYYSPGACSLSPHIVACELGLPISLEKVNTRLGQTHAGADYKAINPKGYVPALELDDGQVLTESAVVSQYLADLKPEAGLIPAAGTMERWRVQEWMNYVATELHKGTSPLFNPKQPEDERQKQLEVMGKRWAYVDGRLADRPWAMGDHFTIVDAYLFNIATWTKVVKLDISMNPNLIGFLRRCSTRPAVIQAIKEEGLA